MEYKLLLKLGNLHTYKSRERVSSEYLIKVGREKERDKNLLPLNRVH